MKKIYYVLAAVLVTIVIMLAAASFSKSAVEIYTSWYMLSLWAIAAVLVLYLIIRNFNHRNVVYCLFHLSLVVILAGALLTHIFSHSENVYLRKGEVQGDLTLQDFKIENYPSTKTPQNYLATLAITDETETTIQTISINKPFKEFSRRIFLTSFDDDNQGATFIITTDPYGTAITYFGYFLFFHLVPLVLIRFFGKRFQSEMSKTI